VLTIGTKVSWIGTGGSTPLGARPVNQVIVGDTSVSNHVVLADRVLAVGGDARGLTTTVVWLNSGTAP